jgi:hypothetical protein
MLKALISVRHTWGKWELRSLGVDTCGKLATHSITIRQDWFGRHLPVDNSCFYSLDIIRSLCAKRERGRLLGKLIFPHASPLKLIRKYRWNLVSGDLHYTLSHFNFDPHMILKSTLMNFLKKKQEVLGRTNRLLSLIRHGPRWTERVQYFFYCVVFFTAVTFLPSRCLATIRGFLRNRCLATIGGYTYRHTDWYEGFFN